MSREGCSHVRFHQIADKVFKEMYCQTDIAVTIVRHFKKKLCSWIMLFIISSNDYELMRRVSKQFDEKISEQCLQNISKHEVNRIEAAVVSRCFLQRRLSYGIVAPLFEFIMNCFCIYALASSHANKDLSVDWKLWKNKENEPIASVITSSNWISANKLVSADL